MKLKDITTIHYEVCSCSVKNLPFHIVEMQDLVALKLFVLKCHVRRPWRNMAPQKADSNVGSGPKTVYQSSGNRIHQGYTNYMVLG